MIKMPPNPYYAFITLNIGEFNMTLNPPNHVQGFSYTRTPMNAANKFKFTLFDDTAILLEYQLIKGYEDVKFQYGYVNGVISPLYQGKITQYDVDFTPAGATLSIEGMSSSITSFAKPITKTYKNMRIDEIVTDIANEQGWIIGTIKECQPVNDGENANKEFTCNGQVAQVFITNELIPYAKSSDSGDSNYVLNFVDSADGTIVNFYPIMQTGKLFGETTAEYQFKWGSGDRNSKVIDFNPDYSGALRLYSGGATVEAKTIDKVANEMFSITYNEKTDEHRTTLDDKSLYDYQGAKTVIGGSSYSMDEMKNIAAYLWTKQASFPVKADMTILGDPNIQVFDMISVVMLNKDGLPHHSSGIYIVKEVEDEISGGSFTTRLQLFRNAMHIGISDSGGINITMDSTWPSDSVGGPTGVHGSSGVSNSKLVNIAEAEVGQGNYKYNEFIGNPPGSAWCAAFVSWCADQAGILGTSVPKTAGADVMADWYQSNGKWRSAGETPSPGDLIFFNWHGGSDVEHVGIVNHADNPTNVYTIEGNTGDGVSVQDKDRSGCSSCILGYGITG